MTNEVKLAKMILEEAGYKVSPSPKNQDTWPFYMTEEDLYCQNEIWIDKFGDIQIIEEMSLDYVANVLRFLRRRNVNFDREWLGHISLNQGLRQRLIDVLNSEDAYRKEHCDRFSDW